MLSVKMYIEHWYTTLHGTLISNFLVHAPAKKFVLQQLSPLIYVPILTNHEIVFL